MSHRRGCCCAEPGEPPLGACTCASNDGGLVLGTCTCANIDCDDPDPTGCCAKEFTATIVCDGMLYSTGCCGSYGPGDSPPSAITVASASSTPPLSNLAPTCKDAGRTWLGANPTGSGWEHYYVVSPPTAYCCAHAASPVPWGTRMSWVTCSEIAFFGRRPTSFSEASWVPSRFYGVLTWRFRLQRDASNRIQPTLCVVADIARPVQTLSLAHDMCVNVPPSIRCRHYADEPGSPTRWELNAAFTPRVEGMRADGSCPASVPEAFDGCEHQGAACAIAGQLVGVRFRRTVTAGSSVCGVGTGIYTPSLAAGSTLHPSSLSALTCTVTAA